MKSDGQFPPQAPSQQHQQIYLQQHTMYNNVHNMTSHGQPETYVLPVHGNFLKVYHCPEPQTPLNAEGNLLLNQAFSSPHPTIQATNHATYHMQAHPTAQIFDSYELFSSPTFSMPNLQNQRTIPHYGFQAHQAPVFMMNSNNVDDQSCPTNQTTNMIINKLVNNWSPNLTGTYTQFGTPISTHVMQQNTTKDVPPSLPTQLHIGSGKKFSSDHVQSAVQPVQNVIDSNSIDSAAFGHHEHHAKLPQISQNSFAASSATSHEVKKRMVAEVKPMRMTYSDVLSKVNNTNCTKRQTNNFFKGADGKFETMTSSASQTRDSKSNSETSGGNSTRKGLIDDSCNNTRNSIKKSPTHENKENIGTGLRSSKRASQISSTSGNYSNTSNTSTSTTSKLLQNTQKLTQKHNILDNSSTNNGTNKKRTNKRETINDSNKTAKSLHNEKEANTYYNVTAKRNVITEPSNKINTNTFSNSSNNVVNNGRNKQNTRNSSSSTLPSVICGPHVINTSNSHPSNSNRFSRYNNSSNMSNIYSYSSKRNRGSNFSTAYHATSDQNYELAKKILYTWLQFMLKILAWLFYLVYDIVVLGFSMVYDRLWHTAAKAFAYAKQLHRELKQNSNKPTFWMKNAWRRFDARFKKNSRVAFWRNIKKKPPEPLSASFKQGRLPQTGEEAMYSLLNCKGKDAYSILGVPPDSSQEQIRKHYKKIAVLVHPDKNKQAGAEEAFKVLQRAFELIGEPDKRLHYDQSLAEALHAEKTWTELHDLLSQLQTKITEAASTIRCSTCALRHPRRLIDRPPFSARECALCKIRHSAREGDIWAETRLLGLRWKYLAMMEGKIYDITEWANCQKGALSHLEPNSHVVQYRIVRGAQQQQQQQQQQKQQQPQQQQNQQQGHQHHQHQQHSPHHNQFGNGSIFGNDFASSEASLDDFLDNLYSGQNPNNSNASTCTGSRRRNRRN